MQLSQFTKDRNGKVFKSICLFIFYYKSDEESFVVSFLLLLDFLIFYWLFQFLHFLPPPEILFLCWSPHQWWRWAASNWNILQCQLFTYMVWWLGSPQSHKLQRSSWGFTGLLPVSGALIPPLCLEVLCLYAQFKSFLIQITWTLQHAQKHIE